MKKIVLVFAVAVLATAPVLAMGATIKAGESYNLRQGDIMDDNLYAAGGSVNIAGITNGDLIVAGGSLMVSGPVSGDLAAAGGTINVVSNIAGDARIVGGNIIILSSVTGDLVIAGGQINVSSSSAVGKDVQIAGGSVNFEGQASGNLNIMGESVYIDGTVAKDVVVKAKNIKFGPNTIIEGKLDYYSNSQAVLETGAIVNGATNFHKVNLPEVQGSKEAKWAILGFISIFALLKLVAGIVAGLIMFYFFKPQTSAVLKNSIVKFWPEALRGFIVLVVAPVAVILSFITVIGSTLGVIVLLFFAVMVVIASIMTVLLFAKLCLKYLFRKENYELNWWVIALSFLAFSIISLIPIIGWVVGFVIFLSAFGSTLKLVYNKIRA
jgi:hypothetical protein